MSSTSLIAGSDLNDANPQTLIAMGILKGNGLAIDEVCTFPHLVVFSRLNKGHS